MEIWPQLADANRFERCRGLQLSEFVCPNYPLG